MPSWPRSSRRSRRDQNDRNDQRQYVIDQAIGDQRREHGLRAQLAAEGGHHDGFDNPDAGRDMADDADADGKNERFSKKTGNSIPNPNA